MIFWKFCRAGKLKEVYQRLFVLSSINQINKVSQRYHMDIRNEMIYLTNKKKIKKFMLTDNVPKDFQLIYYSPISKFIIVAYNSSFFLIISILYGLYYSTQHELEYPLYEPDNNLNKKITIYSEVEHYLIYIFMLFYNLVGYLWCRRTPLRIWYNHNNNLYYMILPQLLSKVGRQVILKSGDMKARFKYSSFHFIQNVHVLNSWNYYINKSNFVAPVEYFKFINEST